MPPANIEDMCELAKEVVATVAPDAVLDSVIAQGEVTLIVGKPWIKPAIKALRDDSRLAFDMLVDVTAVDYLEMGRTPRFDVVYHLNSIKHHHRIRLRAAVAEDPEVCCIDSICELWSGASFMERETYDLFGIQFDGHPDLRRILMPDDWKGHPLRKDFPLGGSTSFYYKQETDEYAGEPDDLIPRIRVQDRDV